MRLQLVAGLPHGGLPVPGLRDSHSQEVAGKLNRETALTFFRALANMVFLLLFGVRVVAWSLSFL